MQGDPVEIQRNLQLMPQLKASAYGLVSAAIIRQRLGDWVIDKVGIILFRSTSLIPSLS